MAISDLGEWLQCCNVAVARCTTDYMLWLGGLIACVSIL